MKPIKFDLPIDGIKAKTYDELREHFTVEILGHFRSGLLRKWMAGRNLEEKLAQLDQISADDDVTALQNLCTLFDIEADPDVLKAALAEASGVPGIKLDGANSGANAVAELRKEIYDVLVEYSSEVMGVKNIAEMSSDELEKMTANFLKKCDNIEIDARVRQAENRVLGDIIDRIGNVFQRDGGAEFSLLSVKFSAGAVVLMKATIDAFWAKNK